MTPPTALISCDNLYSLCQSDFLLPVPSSLLSDSFLLVAGCWMLLVVAGCWSAWAGGSVSRPPLASGEGVARGDCGGRSLLFALDGVSTVLAGTAMSCGGASVVTAELELEDAELDGEGGVAELNVEVACRTWSSCARGCGRS